MFSLGTRLWRIMIVKCSNLYKNGGYDFCENGLLTKCSCAEMLVEGMFFEIVIEA